MRVTMSARPIRMEMGIVPRIGRAFEFIGNSQFMI